MSSRDQVKKEIVMSKTFNNSRYSSKVHQRDSGRTALFTTAQQQSQAASLSPNGSSNNIANALYQSPSNNNSSTLLNSQFDDDIYNNRSSSPYETGVKKDYNASLMSQLESQNSETVSIMSSKIGALKNLSMKMGDEINKSKLNLNSLGGDMDSTLNRVKGNFKRMIVMADNTGISWKAWLGFFTVVWMVFFYVWVF